MIISLVALILYILTVGGGGDKGVNTNIVGVETLYVGEGH